MIPRPPTHPPTNPPANSGLRPSLCKFFGPRRESVRTWSKVLPHSSGRLRRRYFIKEILFKIKLGNPLNEICENLKILLKNRGVNFTKEIPLNEISEKLKFLFKKVKGVNFQKEIPLNEISKNIKILLKFDKKFKKMLAVHKSFETPYF